MSSLNPRMTVFDIISEPLVIHRIGDRTERAAIVQELMGHVGLDPRFLSRYPHSFSGGQRQRIGIARAPRPSTPSSSSATSRSPPSTSQYRRRS